jgi:hypothetical protein
MSAGCAWGKGGRRSADAGRAPDFAEACAGAGPEKGRCALWAVRCALREERDGEKGMRRKDGYCLGIMVI